MLVSTERLQDGFARLLLWRKGVDCLQALALDRQDCAAEARRQSWQVSAQEFLAGQPRLDGAPLTDGRTAP